MAVRTRKNKVEATPEMKARAKKMHADGKSYKEIATALGFKYDKAAWNLVNPGPTGRHRGDKAAKAPSKTVGKGRKGAGKPKAAEGSVEARRTGQKRGKKAPKSPAEAALQKDREYAEAKDRKAEESPANKPVTLGRPIDRPVARPFQPPTNGEEVKAVPKPKDRAKKK